MWDPGLLGLAPTSWWEPWEPPSHCGAVRTEGANGVEIPLATVAWQRVPHCRSWAGPPPTFGSPRHSSAAHWAVCCLPRRQTHKGGGQKPPWCARSGAEEVGGSPGAGAQWGCESTWRAMTGSHCQGLCSLHRKHPLGTEGPPTHMHPQVHAHIHKCPHSQSGTDTFTHTHIHSFTITQSILT